MLCRKTAQESQKRSGTQSRQIEIRRRGQVETKCKHGSLIQARTGQ